MLIQSKIDEAFAAAAAAVAEAKAKMKCDQLYCGFAWVQIHDGRSPLSRALRRDYDASKHWQKGVLVWNPGKSDWQNVDVAYAGAKAFAEFFPGEATASSKLD